jgi:hypothetical protein
VTGSTWKILLAACLLAGAGCLMSIVCTAISWWLTGSGYVVTPGGAF